MDKLTSTGEDFLNRTLIMQAVRSTINTCDLVKIEKLLHCKGHHDLDKEAATEWKSGVTHSVKG